MKPLQGIPGRRNSRNTYVRSAVHDSCHSVQGISLPVKPRLLGGPLPSGRGSWMLAEREPGEATG